MEIRCINSTNFTGCRPPYKIPEGMVYPIEKIATEKDILQLSQNSLKNVIGEGRSGIVYDLCSSVFKLFKDTAFPAPTERRWQAETKNLDFLRDLCIKNNNPDYLHNSQKGLFGINFHNKFFIFSSKVPGSFPHPQKNQFNKKNLTALIEILERLDKGMDETRVLHPDLRAQNVHITDDNAGIIDVGVLLKTPIPKGKTVLGQAGIEQPKSDREFVLLNFLSDTGYGTSNLKSFEYDLLSPYLDFADKQEAVKVFDLYMNLKSKFHEKTAYFYADLQEKTNEKIFENAAVEEFMHHELLEHLPADIRETEIDKLQINIFLRKMTQIAQNLVNNSINLKQISIYINKVIDRSIMKIQNAYLDKDMQRAYYYMNFKNQAEIASRLFRYNLSNYVISPEKTSKFLPEKLLKDKLKK